MNFGDLKLLQEECLKDAQLKDLTDSESVQEYQHYTADKEMKQSTPVFPGNTHKPEHHSFDSTSGVSRDTTLDIVFKKSPKSVSKTSLIEKHSKHVEDLKAYYDSEISELCHRIYLLEHQLNRDRSHNFNDSYHSKINSQVMHSPSKSSHSPYRTPSKSSHSSTRTPSKSSHSPNRTPSKSSHSSTCTPSKLCNWTVLPRPVHDERGLSTSLTSSPVKLKERLQQEEMESIPNRRSSSNTERMLTILQDRLEDERRTISELHHMKSCLQEELNDIRQELRDTKESEAKLMHEREVVEGKFSEILHELEVTFSENRQLHVDKMSLELKLRDIESTVSILQAHLHEANREKDLANQKIVSLETELSMYRYHPNRPAREAIYTGGTPPRDQVQTADTTQRWPYDRLTTSLHATATSTPAKPDKLPSTPVTPSNQSSTPAHSVQRRKWLEPSDVGLITGFSPQTPSVTKVTAKALSESLSPKEQSELQNSLLAESALDAVKSKKIYNLDDGYQAKEPLRMSLDSVKAHQEVVSKAEKQLFELQREKQQLEAALSRIPHSGRVTLEIKEKEVKMEERLNAVDRDIGRVRMILRNNKAL